MFELPENQNINASIKVVGVGGGGGNTIEYMIDNGVTGVEFVCANTDLQALRKSRAKTLIQLGEELTRGLGAGANPDVGRKAAEESREVIRDILSGTDMVFITAGMGGGTGTGAAPIFADVAKELGILTVAVVTKPFVFEGKKRMMIAEEGIRRLASSVDSLITIPNMKLLPVLGKNVSLLDAFKSANDVLMGAVQGIAELITRPGLINVDFADVCTVMSEMGMAMMGTASARGDDRARSAAEAAIASPLLEDIDLSGAGGVLVNITAGPNVSIGEFEDVGEVVRSFASDEATVVVGTVIDPSMSDDLRVTVVVTGLNQDKNKREIRDVPKHSFDSHVSSVKKVSPFNERIKVPESNLDYRRLEKPAVFRDNKSSLNEEIALDKDLVGEEEVLDIPAFLRRDVDGDDE